MNYPTLLFDFDYTLADSSTGAIACVAYALQALGLPAAPPEAVRRTIGLSLPATLRQLAPDATADLAPEFERLFMEKAEDVMVDGTHMLAGVPQALRTFRERGHCLGIASTKTRRRIEAILARENLLALFDCVIGGGDVQHQKPHPDALLLAIEQLQTTAVQTLYIGDSTTDAQAAQLAKIDFAAVLTGTTPKAAFRQLPAIATINTLQELNSFL